ncbi:MAG TPA: aminopeptidase, partial [Hellea balneolensis]|nr:aminopeptidase [Hellea balneolensis]
MSPATPTPTDKTSLKDKTMAAAPKTSQTDRMDHYTYSNYNDVRMTHLSLDLDVDFDKKILSGSAIIDFKPLKANAHILKLDTHDLEISSVQGYTRDGAWVAMDYALRDKDPVKGTMLSIPFSKGTHKVRIHYKTSPKAGGLQWLEPSQTKDGKFPYLFSQNQTIFARSMAPLQDTPAVRITYDATLRVPKGLRALMSAKQLGQDETGAWHFEMPQPIPSYLIAIAVGEIDYKPIDEHTGVYAEPYILEKAAYEFEDTPETEKAMSALYGPYRWGQYDMLILPPSFPFGGMENPRLTFLTPTLIVGDKSLVDVVTHELAHSWSGNLVTNATWRDSWLNEGFTTYVENRVTEATEGKRRADMEQVLAMDGLKRDIREAKKPEMTWLKMPADMHHPDEAFSLVAYNKGMFFLMFLEDRFGRDTFDAFLKSYFDHFAFKSITTEDFLDYFKANLMEKYPGKVTMEEVNAWIYGPGLPPTVRKVHSDAFAAVQAQLDKWTSGKISVAQLDTAKWTTQEWLYFLNRLP